MGSFAIVLLLAIASKLQEAHTSNSTTRSAKKTEGFRTYNATEATDRYRIKYIEWIGEDGKVHNRSIEGSYPAVKATKKDIFFYLYTKSNPENGYKISATDFASVAKSPFKKTRKNLFISHGWINSYKSPVNTLITSAALKAADINVFVVDWSIIAKTPYPVAKSAVSSVGEIEATFIIYLIDTYHLSLDDFYLVGHSLGAHVAGCAGATLKKAKGLVAAVIGLDPAGPLYLLSDKDVIHESHAKVVHVIHTSWSLGILSSRGHVDFYPNGGFWQPGCGILNVAPCSHSRAYQYFAESITSSKFLAVACESYASFLLGNCQDNAKTHLSKLIITKKPAGDFYLKTASSEPFGLD